MRDLKYNLQQWRWEWESTLLLTGESSNQSNSFLALLHTNGSPVALAHTAVLATNRETSIDWRLNYQVLYPKLLKMYVTPTLKIQTRRRVAGTGTVAKSGTWWELKQTAPVDVIRFLSWLPQTVYIYSLKLSTPCILAVNFFLLFHLNAHNTLNTYIHHLLPSTCFGVCYTIFRETTAYFLKKYML
jgi:hypothetical protein